MLSAPGSITFLSRSSYGLMIPPPVIWQSVQDPRHRNDDMSPTSIAISCVSGQAFEENLPIKAPEGPACIFQEAEFAIGDLGTPPN